MDRQPCLHGTLVKLRPLLRSDFEALYSVASDPLIWEQHPARTRYQRDVFAELFEKLLASGGALLALDAQTQKAIGSSTFYEWDPVKDSVEVGYTFLSRNCWGHTYNREMKALMLNHAFQFVSEVHFYIGADNLRSQKAIEKIGAKLIERLENKFPNGDPNPTVVYSIGKSTFATALQPMLKQN